jgi:hypothetical protein
MLKLEDKLFIAIVLVKKNYKKDKTL